MEWVLIVVTLIVLSAVTYRTFQLVRQEAKTSLTAQTVDAMLLRIENIHNDYGALRRAIFLVGEEEVPLIVPPDYPLPMESPCMGQLTRLHGAFQAFRVTQTQ
jgi:hypothetical protein